MTNAVVVARTGSVPALVAEMAEKAADYAEAAKASNTRRAYRSDWQAFEAWCAGKGVIAMPTAADTVLAYLIDHAGQLKVATLSRRLSAIREAHFYAGHPLDTSGVAFRDVWRGIRRTHAAPQVQKAPLLTAQLRRTVGALPDTNAGRRDRALLLVGFGAALRRSELAALEVRATVAPAGSGDPRRSDDPSGRIKNRSGRRGRSDRGSLRRQRRDLPGARLQGLADRFRHHVGAGLPRDRPARQHERRGPDR